MYQASVLSDLIVNCLRGSVFSTVKKLEKTVTTLNCNSEVVTEYIMSCVSIIALLWE